MVYGKQIYWTKYEWTIAQCIAWAADNHYNDIIKLRNNYYTSYVYGFRETLHCELQVRMLHVQGEES